MKRFPALMPAAGVFCLALFVRIVYNLTVGKDYIIAYDANFYYDIAVNLKNGGCYCLSPHAVTYGRAPAWPYLMFLIFSIVGSTKDIYARLFLSVLGSGTCVIVYLWARAIFGRRIGLTTGTIAAIYPGLFIYDGWLYSESVYTFFLTVFAYSLYRVQWNGQCLSAKEMNGALTTRQLHLRYSGWAIVAGIALALAAFARPNGTLLIPVVFVWAFIAVLAKMVSWRIALPGAFMVTLLSIVLIAPWAVRNYHGTHMFIPIATGSGVVLAGAYNDAALEGSVPGFSPGMWIPISLVEPPVPLHGHDCCDYTGEQDDTEYALHWIRTL
jgi:4-amino-4-deoxy-L-arabinose transferase-like glycosyltransferase